MVFKTKSLRLGVELCDIEADYRLSAFKPLHSKWLVQLYNHKSTDKGKEIHANCWKKAGIFDAIKLGSSDLPSLDPFADICPLIESLQLRENLSLLTPFPEELDCFRKKTQESEDDCESEWETDGDSDYCSEPDLDDDGKAFDAFDDGLWLGRKYQFCWNMSFNCPNCSSQKVSCGLQS